MTSRRTQKAAEAIREVVSMAILTDLKDPRVRDVTVTAVEVSPDMRQAKIHVSVMGDDARQQLSLRGLQNAAGFLQSKVAKRIDTRYTPRLTFMLDLGVKRSLEISRILQRVLPPAAPPEAADEHEHAGENPSGEHEPGEHERDEEE
jgi:ribosome-binding factor A